MNYANRFETSPTPLTLMCACVFQLHYAWFSRSTPHSRAGNPRIHGLICSDRFYWWRAQAAAYFVRFTNPMLTMLHRHQLKIYPHDHLPRGVINVHVRRGDKITEATLCTDEAFLQQVERLLPGGGSGGGSKLLRHIFLSTEDSLTMEFFKRTDFRISSTNVARTHRSDIKIVDLAAARGIDLELADSLVSLQYALQCDAFVGDLSSNWVRLIDELRSTVRCKAHVPFLDPSNKGYSKTALVRISTTGC